jgi:hypothetical protein
MRPTRFRHDALPLVAADRETLHRGEVWIEGGTFGAWTVHFIQTRVIGSSNVKVTGARAKAPEAMARST